MLSSDTVSVNGSRACMLWVPRVIRTDISSWVVVYCATSPLWVMV